MPSAEGDLHSIRILSVPRIREAPVNRVDIALGAEAFISTPELHHYLDQAIRVGGDSLWENRLRVIKNKLKK